MNKCFPDDNNYPLHTDDVTYYGLTKREYFAGLAMQGLLSNLAVLRKDGFKDKELERYAVLRADALIEELNK